MWSLSRSQRQRPADFGWFAVDMPGLSYFFSYRYFWKFLQKTANKTGIREEREPHLHLGAAKFERLVKDFAVFGSQVMDTRKHMKELAIRIGIPLRRWDITYVDLENGKRVRCQSDEATILL